MMTHVARAALGAVETPPARAGNTSRRAEGDVSPHNDIVLYTALGRALVPGLALVVAQLRDRAALGERRERVEPIPATCDVPV